MRRLLPWLPVFALVAGILWLTPKHLSTIEFFAAFALLAIAMDLALARTCTDLPLYRRHLATLLVVSAFGLITGLNLRGVPLLHFMALQGIAATVGAALGLAFISLSRLKSRRRWLAHSWHRGERRRADASRELILVADPHWSSELVGLQAATAAHPDADWLFLGDCFDVWVGLPGMETPAQARFLAWVRERRIAGRWVGLWMGNREYFLDGHASEFDLMGEGLGGGLPEEGLTFEHGDLINTADGRYRFWNLTSRSGLLWTFFRLLPSTTAARIAAALETKLHTTNREYKLAFPREAFIAAAAEVSDHVFLTGHFHTDQREGKARALPWAFEGRFQVWRNGQVQDLA